MVATLALAAAAQEQPPLDLAPLVPPKAPWLKKNQAPAKKTKPPATKAPVAQKPKKKKKAPPAQAVEVKPGAPFVAAPPTAPPPLPLPEQAKTPEPAKPAEVAAPSQPAAPPKPVEAQLPLPPLVPAPATAEPPLPPLITLSSDLGVLLLSEGLDPAATARVTEGLRGVARISPHARNASLLPKPSPACTDDACWAALAGAWRVDQLLLASYAKGALEVRLIDAAGKTAVASAALKDVPADSAAVTASTEALACKLLQVPAGCTGEAAVNAGDGVTVELDGTALKSGEKRSLPVGLHALKARAGSKSAERALPVLREGAPLLYARLIDGAPKILDSLPAAPAVAAVDTSLPSPAPRRRWNKPVGFVALGASAIVAGAGIYFGSKSKSDLDQAESAYHTNGGFYASGDAALLSSGNSKARSANALFAVSGVLAVAGALFVFAF